MMNINSIKLNNINNPTRKYISFKENGNNDSTNNTAALALQSPDAMIRFQKDFKLSHSADAVQSNPVKALAFKIKRAIRVFFIPRVDDNIDYENRNLSILI